MGKLEGILIDLSFFAKSIKDFEVNKKEITKIYTTTPAEICDNKELFEFIKSQVTVFKRVPSFAEVREHFGIDLEKVPVDDAYDISYYVGQLKERYLRRAVLKFTSSIPESMDKPISDIYRPILRLADEYKSITEDLDSPVKSISDLVEEAVLVIHDEKKFKVMSPWRTLNWCTGGMLPGELAIIAGRPGTGKTWMLYKWAYDLAAQGLRVLLFNTEMSGVATLLRLACLETGITMNAVRNKNLTEMEKTRLENKIKEIGDLKNLVVTDVGFSPSLGQINKHIKQISPEAVFIDSGYLIRADNAASMSRVENAAEVSDALKTAAIVYNVPIICAVQHNREAVKNQPSLATLSLTDSNAWNASFVMSIYPPSSKTATIGVVEEDTWKVHIIKNREGELRTFFVSKSTYEEVDGGEYTINFGGNSRIKITL